MNVSKSIIFFLPTYEPLAMGGAETQVKRISQILVRQGISVLVFTPGNRNLPKYEEIDTVPVYRFPTLRSQINYFFKIKTSSRKATTTAIATDILYLSEYSSGYKDVRLGLKDILSLADLFFSTLTSLYLIRSRISLIQICTISFIAPIGTLCAKILGKSTVIKDSTMDGIIRMYMAPFPNLARNFIIKNAFFVAMTQEIYRNFEKVGIPTNRISIIPNGIEVKNERKNINLNSFNCLFVGNLYQQPAKGIDILIKSWKIVVDEIPLAKLWIVGDGDLNSYRHAIQQLGLDGSISFLGKSNPKPFYEHADIFILPSRREGLSNALMEAMAYGLPIVATNISGNNDLVKDGENGYLVEVGNIPQLAKSIIMVLGDEKMRENCSIINPIKVKSMCDLDKVAKMYINLYDSLMIK